jgi:hypothetical protein
MAKERTQRRQATKAANQAAAEQRRRRNAWVWRGVVVVVVVAVAFAGYRLYVKRQLLEQVKTASYRAGMHVAGPVDYTETPPMGGPHNVVWQNCAVYDVPIHNEHAVHALEHGAVWITYRPDLPEAQVEALKTFAADDFMLLSPYPGLKSAVVASAWNHQLALDSASDPRLPAFISEYKNNPKTTPEFGAPCAGGTSGDSLADTLTSSPAGPMAPGASGR